MNSKPARSTKYKRVTWFIYSCGLASFSFLSLTIQIFSSPLSQFERELEIMLIWQHGWESCGQSTWPLVNFVATQYSSEICTVSISFCNRATLGVPTTFREGCITISHWSGPDISIFPGICSPPARYCNFVRGSRSANLKLMFATGQS